MIHVNPADERIVAFKPKETELRLPFHVAGNCLITTGGLPEVHPRPEPSELKDFIERNREANRRWKMRHNAGQTALIIHLR